MLEIRSNCTCELLCACCDTRIPSCMLGHCPCSSCVWLCCPALTCHPALPAGAAAEGHRQAEAGQALGGQDRQGLWSQGLPKRGRQQQQQACGAVQQQEQQQLEELAGRSTAGAATSCAADSACAAAQHSTAARSQARAERQQGALALCSRTCTMHSSSSTSAVQHSTAAPKAAAESCGPWKQWDGRAGDACAALLLKCAQQSGQCRALCGVWVV